MNLLPPYTPTVWKAIATVVGLIVVIGAVLFGIDRCGTWKFNKGVSKDKQKISNTIGEISNIKEQQANLAQQEAEKRGELKRDMETLANQTFGREEAKAESNQAIANFEKALNANTNVNATANDIEKALEKLDQ